jgi:hypothetical protein
MVDPYRRSFGSEAEFDEAWGALPSAPSGENPISKIAEFVGSSLARQGFRAFHNGGLPLLTRRHGNLWEEIVFAAHPSNKEFEVRFHLNHQGVGEVRARFWRPAIRAPKAVASGNIGQLETPPVWHLWSSEGHARTGDAIVTALQESVLPWMDLFDDPPRLRELLQESRVPLVDLCTAVELMIAEFDAREARRFLRSMAEPTWPPLVVPKPKGFELNEDRLATVTEYYRL